VGARGIAGRLPGFGLEFCLQYLTSFQLYCGQISPQFVKHVRGGRAKRNKDGCVRWLKRTNAFLERMAVVIHIVYGQPARAEELGTLVIKNHINMMRGIYYWSRGRVIMIALSSNKTRSTNGKEKVVARFLPEEVGDLLVEYISLVRPLEAFIVEQTEFEVLKSMRSCCSRIMNALGMATNVRNFQA
jgi:hypothetical protein